MKLAELIEPVYPDHANAKDWRKLPAVKVVEAREQITLANLIDLADRDDTPSFKLREPVASSLMGTIFDHCRSENKEQGLRKLSLPLSLVPRYSWAERFTLSAAPGQVTIQYFAGQDYLADMRAIRKDILRG